jgi:alpha-glucosidase (family GH31 glycosyl hydrolase)
LLHYPFDENVFNPDTTENAFIVGSGLMVAPVLEAIPAGTTNPQMSVYFPAGPWVSLKSKNFGAVI